MTDTTRARVLSALRRHHGGQNGKQLMEMLCVSRTHIRRSLDLLHAEKRIHIVGWHKTKPLGGKFIPIYGYGAGVDVDKIDHISKKDAHIRMVSCNESSAVIDRLRNAFVPNDPFRVLRVQVGA